MSQGTTRRQWLLAGLVITLIHSPILTKPFIDSDEAVYASVAALTNGVGRLYAEGGVDNKFPGIFWIYGAIFRVFGRYSMTAVHAVTVLLVLATAFVLGKLATRLGHGSAAWVVALFYGIATTLYTPKMLAANTELYTMLPLSLAALVVLDEPSPRLRFLPMYAAGLLIGAAGSVRQLAALNIVWLCGLPLFWSRESWPKRIASSFVAALGFGTVAALVAWFFVTQGTLQDFWFWTVSVVRLRYFPQGWHTFSPVHHLGVLAVSSVFWVLAGLRSRRWRDFSFAEKALWGWLAVSVGIVLLPGRFSPHYAIQAFGPLVILAGIEFRRRLDEARAPAERRFVGWCTGLLAALTVVFFTIAVFYNPFAPSFLSQTSPRYLGVATYVRDTTALTDRIFVWGAYTPIYVMSDRLPASRFVAFKRGCDRHVENPFGDCWDTGPEMWSLLAHDLEANSPALIVDTAAANLGDFGIYPIKSFPLLRELLATRYSEERTINGVVIYRRLPSPA
jgi:hypothetical protein